MLGRSNKSGFTLLEILVAITIVMLMATIIIPNLRPSRPGYERQQFIARLNALCRLAWTNALMTTKTHKVMFDFDKNTVQLQQETDKKDTEGQPIFEPVKGGGYMNTSLKWPKNLDVKNFYIEGFDEMQRFSGTRSTRAVWFFVVPSGLAQTVTINMIDTKDRVGGKAPSIGLVLNPFSAQFKVYDSFQK